MSLPSFVARLHRQADDCRTLGSALNGVLLDGAAAELASGGAVAELLAPLADAPPDHAPGLRFTGALHRLVLERRAPALALHYPSVGGTPGDVWPVARAVVEEHLDALRELVQRPVQTNEVGRSTALLGGLLHVAAGTGLPVRLLEMGASGGLNLQVDRYRHEVAGGVVLGDPSSPVLLDVPWQGHLPPLDAPLRIAERAGCDPAPLDPTRTDDRLTLTSYVWPDQLARFERLRGALQVAAEHPVAVEGLPASAFLTRDLHPRAGVATVVWHSVVWQYLSGDEKSEVRALLVDAGQRARAEAPVAHLRLEPDAEGAFAVVLTRWPGGLERVLARCAAHGPPVVWR